MTSMDLYMWRKHHGVSHKALAAVLGVSRATIGRWEKEDRGMPGRWLGIVLRALDEDEKKWVCCECGHEGLEEVSSTYTIQGAPGKLTFFQCPECGDIAYTA